MSQFAYFILLIAGLTAANVSAGRIQKRLVNADNAQYGQFPYMVSMRMTTSSGHACGGTLVTPEHVVTAAHCAVIGATEIPADPNSRFVVTGHVNNMEGGRITRVAEIRNHPGYDVSQVYRNDVSVLKLATPIPFTATERPIPIASSDTGVQSCVISGWGFTHFPVSHSPAHLQTQLQNTVAHEECVSRMGVGVIHDSTLCAGGSSGTGVCSGDSGGPLVCNGELAGVVSFGNPCANGIPDGYARVFYFRDWILDQISDLSPLGKIYMAEAMKAMEAK